LARACSTSLRPARRMKTQLRLSTWRFECGASREICPRCKQGPDSAEHLVFECPKVVPQERDVFVTAMTQLGSGFQELPPADQLELILYPDAEAALDVPLYSYLKKLAAATAPLAEARAKKKRKKAKKVQKKPKKRASAP